MANTRNMGPVYSAIINGGAHILGIGDSQTSSANWYNWGWALPALLALPWSYVVLEPGPTGTHVAGRGSLTTTVTKQGGGTINPTAATIGTGDAVVTCGVTGGGDNPMSAAFVYTYPAGAAGTGDASQATSLGNGPVLSKIYDATSKSVMPWPPCSANANKPWYHGKYLRGAVVFEGGPNTVQGWRIQMRRQGATGGGTNTSAILDLAGNATQGIFRSAFTAALADGGGYDLNSPPNYPNDHEVQLLHYAKNDAAYDETGLLYIQHKALWATTDAGGNLPTVGPSLDFCGRSGVTANGWLQVTQARWQQYIAATVLETNPTFVIPIMLGHNVTGAEKSGGVYTATMKQDVYDLASRVKAACLAVFPSATVYIVLIVPWLYSGSGMSDVTAGDSLETIIDQLVDDNGWAKMSFYTYFAKAAPLLGLHSGSAGEGLQLGAAFLDMLQEGNPAAARGSANGRLGIGL